MSVMILVPLAVPSLNQGSIPVTPSLARKTTPLINEGTKYPGEALAVVDVVLMSLTRTVPLVVPSLFQSSLPLPSLAEK